MPHLSLRATAQPNAMGGAILTLTSIAGHNAERWVKAYETREAFDEDVQALQLLDEQIGFDASGKSMLAFALGTRYLHTDGLEAQGFFARQGAA